MSIVKKFSRKKLQDARIRRQSAENKGDDVDYSGYMIQEFWKGRILKMDKTMNWFVFIIFSLSIGILIYCDWKIALGIFLFTWANNLQLMERKTNVK